MLALIFLFRLATVTRCDSCLIFKGPNDPVAQPEKKWGGQNDLIFLTWFKIVKAHIKHEAGFSGVRKNFERGGGQRIRSCKLALCFRQVFESQTGSGGGASIAEGKWGLGTKSPSR